MEDPDKFRADLFVPLFRRFVEECGKSGTDLTRIIVDEDGKLTAEGLNYAKA